MPGGPEEAERARRAAMYWRHYHAPGEVPSRPASADEAKAEWEQRPASHPGAAVVDARHGARCSLCHDGTYEMGGWCVNCHAMVLGCFTRGHPAAAGQSGPRCPSCAVPALHWSRRATDAESASVREELGHA